MVEKRVEKEGQNTTKWDTSTSGGIPETALNARNPGTKNTRNATIVRNKTTPQFQVQKIREGYQIIKPKKTHDPSAFYLEDEELKRLLEAARSFQERLILELMIYCGLRRAEIRGLNVENVDFDRQLLHLTATKGAKPREVPAPKHLIDRLALYLKDHRITRGPIFTSPQGKRLNLKTINRVVSRAGKRARITHPADSKRALNPHLLRHTFARRYLRGGGRMEVLQKLLGHSSITTTIKIYGSPSLKLIQEDYYNTVNTI